MLCAVSSSGDGARLRSPAREAVVVTGSFFPPGTVHVWSLDAQRGAVLGLLAEAVKSVSPHRLDEVNRRGRRAGSWRRWRPDRRKLLTAVAVFAAGGRASLRAGELLPSLAPSLSLSLSLSLPQLAPFPVLRRPSCRRSPAPWPRCARPLPTPTRWRCWCSRSEASSTLSGSTRCGAETVCCRTSGVLDWWTAKNMAAYTERGSGITGSRTKSSVEEAGAPRWCVRSGAVLLGLGHRHRRSFSEFRVGCRQSGCVAPAVR